jgi:hypothetical protein
MNNANPPTERFDENDFRAPLISKKLTIAQAIAVFRAILQQFNHQTKLHDCSFAGVALSTFR